MGADVRSLSLGTALTIDRALTLVVDPAVRAPVEAWLPRHLMLDDVEPNAHVTDAAAAVHVYVSDGARAPDEIVDGTVAATFGPVIVRALGDRLALDTPTSTRGVVDLVARQAALYVDPGAPAEDDAVRAMLTVAVAALLGRLGRALAHAAALVAPDGRAWLLAGDTHSGKSTTCATLLDAGWRYCSDDHIVLSSDTNGIHVEGWPRVLHLDDGWEHGHPLGGERGAVDAFTRWPGRWLSHAPVAGVLLPTVVADAPSCLLDTSPASRLTMLVRQSPWLFTDGAAAPNVLALLQRTALLPGAGLRLGRDTFRRAEQLRAVLAPLLER